MIRLFHIIAVNVRTGSEVRMTGYPMPHKESCTMLSKFTQYAGRRLQLQEVAP